MAFMHLSCKKNNTIHVCLQFVLHHYNRKKYFLKMYLCEQSSTNNLSFSVM